MSHAPIRVGLFLLGVGPSPSGVWTRLRDMVGALSGETELELYAAVTSESERDLLALPPERTGHRHEADNANHYDNYANRRRP